MNTFQKVDFQSLSLNAAKEIGEQWMLVTAGSLETPQSYNTMTASWGGWGFLWNKECAFIFVRPQRYTFEFMEKNTYCTLSFFSKEYKKALQFCGSKSGRDYNKAQETGLTPFETEKKSVSFKEACFFLECKIQYKDFLKKENFLYPDIIKTSYAASDFHKMYVAHIENAWIKPQ